MPYDVRQYRTRLGQMLQHSPPTIDEREFRVNALNAAYMSINDMADLLFAEVETDWKVWTERDGENLGITVAVTSGSYAFTFSGSLGASFTSDAGGQDFEDDQGNVYTINRFTSTTAGYFASPYAGATNAAMTVWKIKPYRFYMPVDCARPLAFLNRDVKQQWAGWIPIIDRRTEERNFSPWSTYSSNVVYVADNTAEYDRAPDIGMTLTESTAAGSLAASSDYEVCYTTTQEGRESPPSKPVRITMSSAAGFHEIVVADLEDTRDGLLPTGIYKNVYIRRLTSSQDLPAGDFYSRWLLASADVAEATTTVTISSFPRSSNKSLTYQNGRKFMRTIWRPGQDMTLRLRYLVRPDPLVADSDVPRNWPPAYQDLVVLGAAIDIGTSQGQSTAKIAEWRNRYKTLLDDMLANCTQVANAPSQRQMRTDGSGAAGVLYTNGPVYGNYGT